MVISWTKFGPKCCQYSFSQSIAVKCHRYYIFLKIIILSVLKSLLVHLWKCCAGCLTFSCLFEQCSDNPLQIASHLGKLYFDFSIVQLLWKGLILHIITGICA